MSRLNSQSRAALRSLQKQPRNTKVLVVNDTGQPVRSLQQKKILPEYAELVSAGSSSLGQWGTFRLGVRHMPKEASFGLLHDDDLLLGGYQKVISRFSKTQRGPWVATSNIVELESLPRKIPVLKNPGSLGPFRSSAELAYHYSKSFLPFPGTFFHLPKKWILKSLDPSFEIFTDAVLLIHLADLVPVHFLPESIYAYRRHAGQESTGFHHRMEDCFLAFLEKKTKGTMWQEPTRLRLAQKIAGRFFQASWERGTFRHHEFKKKFPYFLMFRAVRNGSGSL